jgi:hypothetical protein
MKIKKFPFKLSQKGLKFCKDSHSWICSAYMVLEGLTDLKIPWVLFVEVKWDLGEPSNWSITCSPPPTPLNPHQ